MAEAATNHVLASDSSVAVERKPVNILVVDDNRGKLLALETALAPMGENVVCSRSGREALLHMLTTDFATVVLDVNMPEMDGFETARMVRSRARSAATPIIFVSAVNMDEADAHRGYSLGAVDYIFAPIDPEVLRAKVSVFVELHRKSEEVRIHAERLQERTRQLEQSQRELRLSERMASIGTLCAGLGHDMGNLLLPISIWLETLKPSDLSPTAHEGVASLRSCVEYLRKLATGLRLVSLDPAQSDGRNHVELESWLAETSPILRNALPQGVTFESEVEADLPEVCIAPHRLAQAIFNLVQNAGEALRGHPAGVVRFQAQREPAGGVRITLSDNGQGMPPDVLKHCLDPFFTTKTRGISTGLGLSLVHGIVHSAGSQLEVNSMPGTGTTFSFVLPIAEPTGENPAQALITVTDGRARALAKAIAAAAGFDVRTDWRRLGAGAAVWLTDSAREIPRHAERFGEGRTDRRIILVGESGGPPGVHSATLAGADGLAAQLSAFLADLNCRESHATAERPAREITGASVAP